MTSPTNISNAIESISNSSSDAMPKVSAHAAFGNTIAAFIQQLEQKFSGQEGIVPLKNFSYGR